MHPKSRMEPDTAHDTDPLHEITAKQDDAVAPKNEYQKPLWRQTRPTTTCFWFVWGTGTRGWEGNVKAIMEA